MDNILIIILSILWAATGMLSFIYWWTKDWAFELTAKTTIVFVMSAFTGGIISFFVGWLIHGKDSVINKAIKESVNKHYEK